MVAADDIIAVVVPNAMDAHGLNLLMRKIQRMSTRFPHLRLSGVVVNRYARSDVADEEVLNDLTDQLGARLLTPVVPDSAAIKRANNQGLPIAHYHPLQPGLIAVFAALARQVLPEASRAGGRHRHTKEDT
jgi:cellulose biosynthesis protein BcsQ